MITVNYENINCNNGGGKAESGVLIDYSLKLHGGCVLGWATYCMNELTI